MTTDELRAWREQMCACGHRRDDHLAPPNSLDPPCLAWVDDSPCRCEGFADCAERSVAATPPAVPSDSDEGRPSVAVTVARERAPRANSLINAVPPPQPHPERAEGAQQPGGDLRERIARTIARYVGHHEIVDAVLREIAAPRGYSPELEVDVALRYAEINDRPHVPGDDYVVRDVWAATRDVLGLESKDALLGAVPAPTDEPHGSYYQQIGDREVEFCSRTHKRASLCASSAVPAPVPPVPSALESAMLRQRTESIIAGEVCAYAHEPNERFGGACNACVAFSRKLASALPPVLGADPDNLTDDDLSAFGNALGIANLKVMALKRERERGLVFTRDTLREFLIALRPYGYAFGRALSAVPSSPCCENGLYSCSDGQCEVLHPCYCEKGDAALAADAKLARFDLFATRRAFLRSADRAALRRPGATA
jgi:hypothetical protein